MKRIGIILLVSFLGISISVAEEIAVKDSSWKINGFASLNLNQVSFTNWAAGGDNSVAFSALGKLIANYRKGKHAWENRADMRETIRSASA